MASAAPPPLNLCTVLLQSKRIVNAHSRHFLALSVLFLLPLAFSSIVYPTIQTLLSDHPPNNSKAFLQFSTPTPAVPTRILVLAAAFSFVVVFYSLCAVGSITYSVFHGFYGRPVKLASAVKSVFASFFPLLGTLVVSQIFVLLLCALFGVSLFLVARAAELMDSPVDYFSPLLAISSLFAVAVFVVLMYLQVNWALAFVVVVVESTWGFGALTRSAHLIKGMRGVALSLVLFFGVLAAVLGLCGWVSALGLGGDTDGWKSLAFAVQIVATSTSLVLLMLYSAAANTVLYMYCRAVNGELASEIAGEFATDYVSLPFDDEKVPHVVSVAYAT